jgi:hypothetical protein
MELRVDAMSYEQIPIEKKLSTLAISRRRTGWAQRGDGTATRRDARRQ